MDGISEVTQMEKNYIQTRNERTKQSHRMSFVANNCCLTQRVVVGQVTPIDMLPDDILLEIFEFYVDEAPDDTKRGIEAWQKLVHVCRLWRNTVFGSPHRLNLRLVCTPETPVRKAMDVWPVLPLCIRGYRYDSPESADDTLAALRHSDRIYRLELEVGDLDLKDFFRAMEVPFPELTYLKFSGNSKDVPISPVVPDSFLGGSAPRLKTLILNHVSFPGFPKLLLSATNLVTLRLHHIPRSGYISSAAMVTCLPMLTSLRQLMIIFPYADHKTRHLSRQKRSVLPALTFFEFEGAGKYLKHLVAHVDAPRLKYLKISINIRFATPLLQFVGRTPSLEAPDNARFAFTPSAVRFTLLSHTGIFSMKMYNGYPFRMTDLRVLTLARVCTSALPLLSTVKNIAFYEPGDPPSQLQWADDIEVTRWLELLQPFTAVKNLYLSEGCGLHIAPALQELVEGRMIEVLPSLENLFISGRQPSGPVHEGIGPFVAARQLTVSHWDQRSIIPKVL